MAQKPPPDDPIPLAPASGPKFSSPVVDQCFTWGGNGVINIPVTITGGLNPNLTYVFNVTINGVQANGDYAYPGPINVQPGDYTQPTECVEMKLDLISIDTSTTPPTRKNVTNVKVQLCPECA